MDNKKYSLWLCALLFTACIDSQVPINLEQLPPEVLKQLRSLSPEDQERLLEQYEFQIPNSNFGGQNEFSTLGTRQPFLNDTRIEIQSDSSILEEDIINQSDADEIEIERFGLSFFSQEISTFAPVDDISVPDNYILGIGDSLVIQTMGSSFERYELQIQRDGSIVIENLGIVSVAGLSINQASSLIKQMFSEQSFGSEVSVNLGRLRAMNIFMAGEVKNPGMYSVSSLTTVTQALYQSGGITNLGSLRNIKVLRNGKNIATFDAYDLLIYGDSSNDIRLRSGDVVLVQPYQRLVTVNGESKRPMIYELLPNETVSNLLNISSGLSQFASPTNAILISKKAPGATPEILSLNLLEDKSLNLLLGFDDTLIIPKANQRPDNYIEIVGAHYRSGFVYWRKGIYLSDIFTSIREDFPDYVDLDFSLISRKSPDYNFREYIPFSLRELFENKSNFDIELQNSIKY